MRVDVSSTGPRPSSTTSRARRPARAPRERSAAAVYEIATKCSFIDAPGDTIAETDQDAFLQRFLVHFTDTNIKSFIFSDAKELIEQRPDLSRGNTVNAHPPHDIHAKLVLCCILPGAHQNPKVRRYPINKKLVASGGRFFIGFPHEQIAPLCKGRHETRVIDATIILRREQHASVTGMNRKREHAPAQLRDRAVRHCSKIREELLGMTQR